MDGWSQSLRSRDNEAGRSEEKEKDKAGRGMKRGERKVGW